MLKSIRIIGLIYICVCPTFAAEANELGIIVDSIPNDFEVMAWYFEARQGNKEAYHSLLSAAAPGNSPVAIGFKALLNMRGSLSLSLPENTRAADSLMQSVLKSLQKKSLNGGQDVVDFILGDAHYYGVGTMENQSQGMSYYEQAAASENYAALNVLGCRYLYGGPGCKKDPAAARQYLQNSADQGFSFAIFNLGAIHYKGLGTERNYVKAAEYFETAINKGHCRVGRHMANIFQSGGHGVIANRSASLHWLQVTERNMERYGYCPEVFQLIALEHSDKEGEHYDQNLALQYFQKCADKNVSKCQFHLGSALLNGGFRNGPLGTFFRDKNVLVDKERGLTILRDCAENGGYQCLMELAIHHSTSKAAHDALFYLHMAAEMGSPSAMIVLGKCYEFGQFGHFCSAVPRNLTRAREYYEMARRTSPDAETEPQERLNQMDLAEALSYQMGINGVEQNVTEAMRLYQAMIDRNGNTEAVFRLKIIKALERYNYRSATGTVDVDTE